MKIPKENLPHPEYLNNEAYDTGYRQEAYKKRKIKTLISGGIGLLVGIGTSFILHAKGVDIINQ